MPRRRRSTLLLTVALGLLFWRIWLQAAPVMPAVLVPTPNQLVFGDVYVGTVATATATWKSTSQAAATVTGLAVQGPNAAQVTWTAAAPLANVQVTSTQATPVVTFSLRGGLLPGRGARAPVLSRSRGPAVIYGSVEIVGIH